MGGSFGYFKIDKFPIKKAKLFTPILPDMSDYLDDSNNLFTYVNTLKTHLLANAIDKFNIKDGIYTFEKINLPKEGRWDIMAKINIGKDSRFYNLKVDTRNNTVVEY